MPFAFVLDLECLKDGALYGFTGQHNYYYWQLPWRHFLQEVRIQSGTLDFKHVVALSPLTGTSEMRHRRTPLLTGDVAQMRVSILLDELGPVLHEYMLGQIGNSIEIGDVAWRIRSIEGPESNHPEVGYETYGELRRRPLGSTELPTQWQVSYESPTVVDLGGDGRYLPFPLPHRLIRYWLESWQMLAPKSSSLGIGSIDEFVESVAHKLEVSRYALKAVGTSLLFDDSLPEAGCKGKATIKATGLERAEAEILSALMRYSFYRGSGVYSELGLGQTRILRAI